MDMHVFTASYDPCYLIVFQTINVCVSYLLQFCMNNGLSMSAKNMDTIYQAMLVREIVDRS